MPEQPASEDPGPAEAESAQRLRPSAVPIWFLYDAGRGVLAFIPILFIGPGGVPFIMAMSLVLLISPVIRYKRFRYQIHDNTLIVEGGLINRWRRVIPRERVQSVNVVQKLRHRAFGVLELRIEAVGGQQTEAALVALTPQEAERIRSWASGDAAQTEATAESTAPPLARLTGRDLLIAGVTGGRVAVLAALIGYSQEYIGEDSLGRITGFIEQFMPGASLIIVITTITLAVVVLSLLLSIALTILVYWEFTVRMEEDRVAITRGLLEKRRAQVPLRRVQAIQVNENLVRRPLGLASLTMVVAGYTTESEQQESSVLLPLGRREHAWQVASAILNAPAALASLTLTRPPVRSAFRRAIVPTALGIGAGLAGWATFGRIGALAFLFVPLAWAYAGLTWAYSGYGLVPGYVVVRAGFLVRKTSIVPESNIQHLQLTWSVFQEKFRLANVRVHIPGGLRSATDMERQDALRWFQVLGSLPPD